MKDLYIGQWKEGYIRRIGRSVSGRDQINRHESYRRASYEHPAAMNSEAWVYVASTGKLYKHENGMKPAS